MNTLEQMSEFGHELVSFHQDPETGLRAIAAVHDSTLGPGFGGCRRWYYATESDALHDVLRLSEGMTYKNAIAGLPVGGGKSVILKSEPKAVATEAEARAMGRFVERLGGNYISAEDVGITTQYIDWMATETKYVCGGVDASAASGGGDPSPHTAQGVVNAMKAALAYTGRPSSFENVHVAIQGAGNVGQNIARIVTGLGGRVTVADINVEAVERVVAESGATAVPVEEILAVECDILSPCALGGVINARTIAMLNCPILCPGANNLLEDYDIDGRKLKEAGIVYVPDFVANAGGVIELAGFYCGLDEGVRKQKLAGIEATSLELLKMSENEPNTYFAAVALAKKRIRQAKEARTAATTA